MMGYVSRNGWMKITHIALLEVTTTWPLKPRQLEQAREALRKYLLEHEVQYLCARGLGPLPHRSIGHFEAEFTGVRYVIADQKILDVEAAYITEWTDAAPETQ